MISLSFFLVSEKDGKGFFNKKTDVFTMHLYSRFGGGLFFQKTKYGFVSYEIGVFLFAKACNLIFV